MAPIAASLRSWESSQVQRFGRAQAVLVASAKAVSGSYREAPSQTNNPRATQASIQPSTPRPCRIGPINSQAQFITPIMANLPLKARRISSATEQPLETSFALTMLLLSTAKPSMPLLRRLFWEQQLALTMEQP